MIPFSFFEFEVINYTIQHENSIIYSYYLVHSIGLCQCNVWFGTMKRGWDDDIR